MRKLTTKEWIKKANEVHKDRYDYSKSIYNGSKYDVEIICHQHGSFWQRAGNHVTKGYGCTFCSTAVLYTKEQWVEKCRSIHGDSYDYSLVEYHGVKYTVTIICHTHGGTFEQKAETHFFAGCNICSGNKKKTTDKFIEDAKVVHGNYYDYSLVDYKNSNTDVIIICPSHGKFPQSPSNHLKGKDCYRCAKRGNTSKVEQQWLDIMGVPNDILHRNVRFKLGDKFIRVDGYYGEGKIVYEFLGDFWHGNPSQYNREILNHLSKKSFGELFDDTVHRIRLLRKHGFKVITIWEKNFHRKYRK
jgi:hypothetical protein